MIFEDLENRRVILERVDIQQTYLGWLEGHPASISVEIRKRLRKKITAKYGNRRPIQIIDDGQEWLPGYRVFVDMESRQPVRPENDYSLMGALLFVSMEELEIKTIIAKLVSSLEWNKYAIDGSLDDL